MNNKNNNKNNNNKNKNKNKIPSLDYATFVVPHM